MKTVLRSIAFLVLAGCAVFSCCDPWHPEWGPEPPVAPFSPGALPSQKIAVPIIFPVLGPTWWHDSYNVGRGSYRHTGIDIAAAKMTPIVAPFSGTLGMKDETFWIYGDNGWVTLGTHLNDDNLGRHDHRGGKDVMFAPNLQPGEHVVAGQFIGYVGESGNATGPHLHFELYAPGDGPTMSRIRNPYYSLKKAQVIARPVVWSGGSANEPMPGEIRLDGCIRKLDPNAGTITLLLCGKQYPGGRPMAVTEVHYVKIKVTQDQLDMLGGWETLRKVNCYQPVGIFVPYCSGSTMQVDHIFVISAP